MRDSGGEPRDYQAAVLDALGREDWRDGCGKGDRSFHIVAPPDPARRSSACCSPFATAAALVLSSTSVIRDHWALVLHLLRSKIEEAGGHPLLIGLTATPPDPATPVEERNYTGLLGEVDYEVPTPAVIRAGDLAPVRTRAWSTRATPKEHGFIERHERMLEGALMDVFAAPDGLAFLHECLRSPPSPIPMTRAGRFPPPSTRGCSGPRHDEGGRAAIRIRVESHRGSGPGRGSADEGQFVDPRRRAGSEPRGHPDEGENRRALGVAAAHNSGRMAL